MHTIEIRQFGTTRASFPSANDEISEQEFLLANALADALLMHNRLEIGYYEVLLIDPHGDEIDGLEAVA